jgi:hypothetical protein
MSRLFLLLLLGVDWAATPDQLAPAVSVLAHRLASTECFCHSLVSRPDTDQPRAKKWPSPEAVQPPASLSPRRLGFRPRGTQLDRRARPPLPSLLSLYCTWQV